MREDIQINRFVDFKSTIKYVELQTRQNIKFERVKSMWKFIITIIICLVYSCNSSEHNQEKLTICFLNIGTNKPNFPPLILGNDSTEDLILLNKYKFKRTVFCKLNQKEISSVFSCLTNFASSPKSSDYVLNSPLFVILYENGKLNKTCTIETENDLESIRKKINNFNLNQKESTKFNNWFDFFKEHFVLR